MYVRARTRASVAICKELRVYSGLASCKYHLSQMSKPQPTRVRKTRVQPLYSVNDNVVVSKSCVEPTLDLCCHVVPEYLLHETDAHTTW